MSELTENGLTRREFLVRSAVIAGSGFFSIGLPGLVKRAQAAQAAMARRLTRRRSGSPSRRTARPRCTSSRRRWASTSAPASRRSSPKNWKSSGRTSGSTRRSKASRTSPIYGLAYTVNSGSVTTEFDRIARAGAAGRIALVEAGAKVLGAKVGDCYAENSRVIDKVSGRSIGYGEILQKVKIDRKFAYPDDFKKHHAEGVRRVQDHRQVGAGARHPGEDQRPGQVRHRRVPAEHGLRRAGGSAHALRLEGAEHRRYRSEEDSRLHQGREDRRLAWASAPAGWSRWPTDFPTAMKAAKALKVKVDPGPYGEAQL